eukprot:COSAG01_NODE_7907_length_2997_cov_28.082471_4_plen_425_part_00
MYRLQGGAAAACASAAASSCAPDPWSEAELEILVSAQQQMGNKWAKIAELLPKRTNRMCKNRFLALSRTTAWKNGERPGSLAASTALSASAMQPALTEPTLEDYWDLPLDMPWTSSTSESEWDGSDVSVRPESAQPYRSERLSLDAFVASAHWQATDSDEQLPAGHREISVSMDRFQDGNGACQLSLPSLGSGDWGVTDLDESPRLSWSNGSDSESSSDSQSYDWGADGVTGSSLSIPSILGNASTPDVPPLDAGIPFEHGHTDETSDEPDIWSFTTLYPTGVGSGQWSSPTSSDGTSPPLPPSPPPPTATVTMTQKMCYDDEKRTLSASLLPLQPAKSKRQKLSATSIAAAALGGGLGVICILLSVHRPRSSGANNPSANAASAGGAVVPIAEGWACDDGNHATINTTATCAVLEGAASVASF